MKSGPESSSPARQETDSISRRHFSVLALLIAFRASLFVTLQLGFQNLSSVAREPFVFWPNLVIRLMREKHETLL